MIKLLIADDHAIVRGGLKQLFELSPDLHVAAEAINGAEVLDALRAQTFDILLLDLNMPGISGADLIQRVKAHCPNLPILVLSMHNEPQVAERVLKAGATGYLTKDSEPELILSAIRKVAAHIRFIAPSLAEKIALQATSNLAPTPHKLLSNREMEIFHLLVSGKGVNDIAAELLISSKTVSTHKVRLMDKLNLQSLADLMRYAMQHDLLG